METNILGLPSLTGYTPLKATLEGQVLKYDFKGIGPIVIDKSGNGNRGELMPREDPPRRKILSWPPLEMAIALDGENDHVKTPDTPDLDFESNDIFSVEVVFSTEQEFVGRSRLVQKIDNEANYQGFQIYRHASEYPAIDLRTTEGEETHIRLRKYIADGSPHKAVLRYDGEDGEVTFKVDDKSSSKTVNFTGSFAGTTPMYIGRSYKMVPRAVFKGKIRRVTVTRE